MRLLLIIFGILLLQNAHAADAQRSDTMDIKRYSIFLNITDFTTQTIKGFCDIDMVSKLNGVNQTNFDLKALTVDSVLLNGVNTTYSHIGELLTVNHTTLNTNDSARVRVYYHGHPVGDASGWGGFYFSGTMAYNLGVGFDSNPHNYGRVWFPCFDNFVERSKYSFFITTLNTHSALCGGTLVSTTFNLIDSTLTWYWNLEKEIPSYLASVAVSNFAFVNDTYPSLSGSNIPIILGALPSDTNNVKNSFVNLKNCLLGFEQDYGYYRWPRVGYVMVPFSSGAMEHACNIAYPVFAANGTLTYESLYAHELSHHWWGDLITCRTAEDMWINEGWASYSEKIFFEKVYGANRYKNEVRATHYNVLQNAHLDDGDYYPVSGIGHTLTYGTHVYQKGADVAHTLRGYLGDANFFNSIQSLLSAYAFKDINSQDMQTYLSGVSGVDLNPFFDAWVYEKGFPHFQIDAYNVNGSGTIYTVNFTIQQRLHHAPNYYEQVPIEVSFFDSNWQPVTQTFIVNGECQEFTANINFNPVWITLDYNEKISDAITDQAKTIANTGLATYPQSKLNLNVITNVDSSLVRVQHHWVGATKTYNLPSNVHLAPRYWQIDGIINPGFVASAIFNFDGTAANGYIDQDFISTIEDSLQMYYKAQWKDDWQVVSTASLNTVGSNNNKKGYFTINDVKAGYYTFGIRNAATPVVPDELQNLCALSKVSEILTDDQLLQVQPNPIQNMVNISWNKDVNPDMIRIVDIQGLKIKELNIENSYNVTMSMQNLAKGTYYVSLISNGKILDTKAILLQ